MGIEKYAILHSQTDNEYFCLALDLCVGRFFSIGDRKIVDHQDLSIRIPLEEIDEQNLQKFIQEKFIQEKRSGSSSYSSREMEKYVFIGRLHYRIPVINMAVQESERGKRVALAREGRKDELVTILGFNEVDFVGRSYEEVIQNGVFGIGDEYKTPKKLMDPIEDFFKSQFSI